MLNDEREMQFFIFLGTIAQIFGAKRDMFSVPYLTVIGFLLYSFWRVLRLYVGDLLSFIMSPIIAGEKPRENLYISIAISMASLNISMMDSKRPILFKKSIK